MVSYRGAQMVLARKVWKQLGIRKEEEICRVHERQPILAIFLQLTSDQYFLFRI